MPVYGALWFCCSIYPKACSFCRGVVETFGFLQKLHKKRSWFIFAPRLEQILTFRSSLSVSFVGFRSNSSLLCQVEPFFWKEILLKTRKRSTWSAKTKWGACVFSFWKRMCGTSGCPWLSNVWGGGHQNSTRNKHMNNYLDWLHPEG